MAFIVGNDIASFQGDVNYDTYKNNSNFIIFKATEGTGYTDTKLSRNQSEARRVGLPLGYYHFARPDLNTAESEANYFLSKIGQLRDGEVLVLDYEPNWNGDAVGWCKTWLDTVFSKTQCKPLIYMDQSRVQKYNWKPLVDAGYGLWIAAYTYDPTNNNFQHGAWPFAAMQQWTNKQQVPGINGNVDGDVFFGDVATFKKYGYKSPTPVDPCANVKKDLDAANKTILEQKSQIDALQKQCDDYKNKLKQINDLSK